VDEKARRGDQSTRFVREKRERKTHFCRRCRGMWFDASVKMRRKSLAPTYKSRPSKCFVFKDDAITGTMLSMVYVEMMELAFKEMNGCRLTFWTTLKLYESSLWNTLDPMNVKMGIMLWRTESGVSRAKLAIKSRASLNV
jgi:hypothetical protein